MSWYVLEGQQFTKRMPKCVTALDATVTHLPPHDGIASMGACSPAAGRRARIPCVAARNAQGLSVGWTPTVVRLGALCRRRLGAPLLVAPAGWAGWGNEAERLLDAPRTGILTRLTVWLLRSRDSANAIGPTFSKHPVVECGTANKANASFRVGELR